MSKKVVVIGGGLSGLASAVWLGEAGWDVTILERRAALGGRTHAVAVPQVDDVADNGQHIMARAFVNLFRYLEAVGTMDHMHFSPVGSRMRDGSVHPTKQGIGSQLQMLFGALPGLPARDRLKTTIACLRFFAQAARADTSLDTISVAEWYRRVGMPDSARSIIFDLLALGVLNELPELASAYPLASLLSTAMKKSLHGGGSAFEFGFSDVDFDSLYVHGAQKLFTQRGHDVHYRAIARQIEIRGDRVVGVRLSDGDVIDADAVVCAVPVWNVHGLLDQMPGHDRVYAAADKLPSVPIVSVNLYLDGPLGSEFWLENIANPEHIVDNVFDHQIMHPGRDTSAGYRYALTTSAAYMINDWTNERMVGAQMDLLRQCYPQVKRVNVLHANVVREVRATFTQRPGSLNVRPSQQTRIPNLVLAGDWTQTEWCSTMEGAVQSASFAVSALQSNFAAAAPVTLGI